jgi:pimeloyl-ACP methyl ester carboxylesterase
MQISNLPAITVLTAAFVAGCEAREKPAGHQADQTRNSDNESSARKGDETKMDGKGQYATVNGLKMYYEIHGAGRPLVLLHGAFGFATVYPSLAKDRQTIAVELQGHGHTADRDRPLNFEQMADDVAGLLEQLKVEQADFFGYSMGGNVGIAVAIRHPKLVRKLAINGSHAGRMADAYYPEAVTQFNSLPADFAPPVLKGPYDKVAPDPTHWPTLVAKVKQMGLDFKGFTHEELKGIKAQILISLGDRDGVRVEHAVEMFRLIPNSQLAVFPNADHLALWLSPEKVLPTIAAFLEAPMPEPKEQSR